jgi:hypothetical protein
MHWEDVKHLWKRRGGERKGGTEEEVKKYLPRGSQDWYT